MATNTGSAKPVWIEGATSLPPGSGASDLGKAEDAAHASGDVGVMALGVRNDAAAALTSANVDYSPIATDSAGRVGISDLGGSITVDGINDATKVDEAAFTVESDRLMVVGGIQTSDQLQAGEAGALGMTPNRALYTNLQNASGTEVGTPGSPVYVSGTQLEDSGSSGGERGTNVLGVRNDAAAALTSTDGDFSHFATDSAGRIGVADLGGSLTVDTVSITPGTSAGHLGKAEDAAHASGDTGVMALGVRNDTRGTLAGTNLDYVPPQMNAKGDTRVEANQTATVDSGNSTTANLANGAVFTGTGIEVVEFSYISLILFASHASATDGIAIQFSDDNVTFRTYRACTLPASTPRSFSIPVLGRYYRLVYTNGGTTTTTLMIQSLLHPFGPADSMGVGVPEDVIANSATDNRTLISLFKRFLSGLENGSPAMVVYTFHLGAAPIQSYASTDTFTATGNGAVIDMTGNPCSMFSLQVVATGAVTSWDVRLEASNDGTNFDAAGTGILQHTNLAPGTPNLVYVISKPCRYLRPRCATLTLGGGTNIIATTLAHI